MSIYKWTDDISGQALVEAIILIPALVTVSCVLIGLLSYSSFPIWMNEILSLSLADNSPEKSLKAVERSRESSSLPPYFTREEVKIQRSDSSVSILPLPLHLANPLSKRHAGGHFLWSKTMERTPFSFLKAFTGAESSTSRMSLTVQNNLSEKTARDLVRKIFMSGLTRGQMMKHLEMSGLNLFHLNFNALTASVKNGEKNERKQ